MAVSAALAVSAFSAQVGDTVTQKVETRVEIPNNQVVEVIHVTLDKGVWLIGGQVDFLERINFGRSTVAAGINTVPNLPQDGSTIFQTEDTTTGFTIIGVSLSPKVFEVTSDGTDIFLVGFNTANPNPPATPSQARGGFLTALKVRNNSGP